MTTTSTWPTDEQLLLEFQQGDQAAFAAIVERHEVRLARIAYRIIGCRHEAEDARHTVFVRFLQQIGQSRQLERVGAWLTRCTVNEAITRARQKNQEGRVMAELATLARTAVDVAPSVQQQADESREQLTVALAKLTPDARAILSLRFDDGSHRMASQKSSAAQYVGSHCRRRGRIEPTLYWSLELGRFSFHDSAT